MHDEASLRRLEEMGIDVYLPRASLVAETPSSPANAGDAATTASSRRVDVLLLAGADATAEPLLAAVARTLAFARVAAAPARADDAAALAQARALVAFGEAQARAAGAALDAQRQAQIGWVVAADVAQLRGDALAKRALWGELKRIVRSLRASAG